MNEQSSIQRDAVISACEGDDYQQAQVVTDAYLRLHPGPASVEFTSRQVDAMAERLGFAEFRLATVTSFTGELLEPFVTIAGFHQQRKLAFANIAYDQWFHALANAGPIDAFNPDAVFVLLHMEDTMPSLARRHIADTGVVEDELAALINGLGEAIAGFRERSQVPLLLANFVAAERTLERYLDANSDKSRQGWIEKANSQLFELARRSENVWLFDYHATVTDHGRKNWFDPVKGDQFGASLTSFASRALAADIMGYIDALVRPRHKVLVLDLDNTIWGGIVGEDGARGIAVSGSYPGNAYAHFQEFLRNLRATGIALATASKNNEEDARRAFEQNPGMPLQWDDFAAHKIGWGDKHISLREIADELKLGLDSIVFADDNPFECDFVREMLSEVTVVQLEGPPSNFPRKILEAARFYPISLTSEDKMRADAYTAERKRDLHRQKTGDAGSFLSQLCLELRYRRPREDEIDRVVQLLNKTNQFNLTLKRYQHSDVLQIIEDQDADLQVAALSDRYGDYGLIGIVVTRDADQNREIDSFLLSCRALGRNVEDAVLAEVEADARAGGCESLIGHFVSGPKNGLVSEFFPVRGFTQMSGGGEGDYARSLAKTPPLARPEHIKIVRD